MSSVYRAEKTPVAFLDDLSKPGFNKQLEIKQVRERTGISYKVTEIAKYHSYNPIRLFASPQPDATKLTMLATNLVGLLTTHEKSLLQFKDTELDMMVKHVENIGINSVRNVAPNQAQPISAKFAEAAGLIKAAKLKKNAEFYAKDRVTLQPKDAVKIDDFYKKLSNAGWLALFGGFNERIVVKEPNPGRFEIYTPKGLWFFQRLFNRPVVAADKLASMQNLNKMIKSHRAFIVQNRYDVGEMTKYLEKVKIAIVRNCTPSEKLAIEKELNETIAELKEDQRDIAASKSNDLWRVVGRGVVQTVLFPLTLYKKFC